MAAIIPFRGYRFDPGVVGSISDVTAPPYDRVYPDVQQACYQRSPYNIVRIIKGRPQPDDDPAENVYTRAAATLRRWIDERVLVQDPEPALYAYHQAYRFEGQQLIRKGIIALGKLEPEKVHAHERTLKGPKEDRLRLMRAAEANFGHIFMLYDDPDRAADRQMAAAVDGAEPLIEATDADGNTHRVWRVVEPSVIEAVQEALAERDLYIADGHHRYETAVNFMQEALANGWRPAAPESFDVRMMSLFNVAEPGMSIRPIHRLIHGVTGFEVSRFLADAEGLFEVEPHPSFDAMAAATEAGSRRHTFGVYAGGSYATLTLREPSTADRLVEVERSADYKRLDVTILHTAILEELLGIDAVALEEQRNVNYTVDPAAGIDAVDRDEEQMLFYLNPTAPEQVVRVADHGEKMPQKSTDFYPKLLTGLVLTVMEIEK